MHVVTTNRPSPEEVANRIKAARQIHGWDAPALADAIGEALPSGAPGRIALKAVRELEQARREIDLDELHAIAVACRVPDWFLTAPVDAMFNGEDPRPPELRSTADRIAALEKQVTRLTDTTVTSDQLQALVEVHLLAAGITPTAADDETRTGQPPQAG